MSYISNALKKIQESRQKQQAQKLESIVYLTDTPRVWPKTALMILFGVGTIAAILISISAILLVMKNSDSKQMQLFSLEETIRAQGKTITAQNERMTDLIIAINKNQGFTDSQMQNLNLRVKEESRDMKARINSLTSTTSTHYDSLKEAILDDKRQIDSLDSYTKTLDKKIEAMSVSNPQTEGR